MEEILDKLVIVLNALTGTAKALHNYEGDRGLSIDRRNELRDKQREINEAIDVLHEVINKVREKI